MLLWLITFHCIISSHSSFHSVKSQSYNGLFSPFWLHLSLLIPSLTHSTPTPLASWLFPAHASQAFTLAFPSQCDVLFPDIQFWFDCHSVWSACPVIASSPHLGHLLHLLTFFPPWHSSSSVYLLSLHTYYVYSLSHSLECHLYRDEDFCLFCSLFYPLHKRRVPCA